jgi:hypothetical protein
MQGPISLIEEWDFWLEGIMNKCPKCGYERKPEDLECPQCGIVYDKYEAYVAMQQAEEEARWQNQADEGAEIAVRPKKLLSFKSVLGFMVVFIVCISLFFIYRHKVEEKRKIEAEREEISREPEADREQVKRERERGKFLAEWEKEGGKLWMTEKILTEYYKSHTSSISDFFVCADRAIDVWNLLDTQGINAKIQTGIVDKRVGFDGPLDFIKKINHAWVLAQYAPLEWVALEITGGYFVYSEDEESALDKNDWYYSGFSFSNPNEFKAFLERRKRYVAVCNEADQLIEEWNARYAGRHKTPETVRLKGMVDAKNKECDELFMQLVGFLKSRGDIPKSK